MPDPTTPNLDDLQSVQAFITTTSHTLAEHLHAGAISPEYGIAATLDLLRLVVAALAKAPVPLPPAMAQRAAAAPAPDARLIGAMARTAGDRATSAYARTDVYGMVHDLARIVADLTEHHG